jgi:hypothetical protein
MSAVWATAFALIYHRLTRYRPGTIAIGIGVVSHWVLDWISHRPDMPLYPGGGPRLGLGLWNHVAATITVEIAMLLVGAWLYDRATRPRDRIGTYAFVAYVLVLLILFIGDRFATTPATVTDIIWTAIIAEIVLLTWPGGSMFIAPRGPGLPSSWFGSSLPFTKSLPSSPPTRPRRSSRSAAPC